MPAPAAHKRCDAQLPNQPAGRTCRNAAGARTDHLGAGRCYRHGGNTPAHKTAARKEIARRACVRFALATAEEIPNLDPRQVLAEELHRSQTVVRALDVRVNELTEIHGPTFHWTGSATGEAKPHVEWQMWADARAHLKAVAGECHRAGVDSYYAKLAEEQSAQLAAIITTFVQALGLQLTPAVRRLLRALLTQNSAGDSLVPDRDDVVAIRGELRAALEA